MRPRQACLGIHHFPWDQSHFSWCFNEAEASLPRNTPGFGFALAGADDVASMRPRQACLGIRRRGVDENVSNIFASMRPRQACLGIPQTGNQWHQGGHQASMRPRQACLGIHWPDDCSVNKFPRFNEAEASLPRNTTIACSLVASQLDSFNEAEASLPRNRPRSNTNSMRRSMLQ